VFVCGFLRVGVCMHGFVWVCGCACVCMCFVGLCVWRERERERARERVSVGVWLGQCGFGVWCVSVCLIVFLGV